MLLRSLCLASLLSVGNSLKAHDFRKCADTPFCLKHRALGALEWTANASTVALSPEGVLTVQVVPPASEPLLLPLLAHLSILRSGAARVFLDEDPSLPLSTLNGADPTVPKPEAWDGLKPGSTALPHSLRTALPRSHHTPSTRSRSQTTWTVNGRLQPSVAAAQSNGGTMRRTPRCCRHRRSRR
jgi:hypothetical protein